MATDYSTLITLSKSLPLEDLRDLFEEVVTDLQATENDTRAATKDFLVDGDTLTQEEFDRLSLIEINSKVVEKMEVTVTELQNARQNTIALQSEVNDLTTELGETAAKLTVTQLQVTELEESKRGVEHDVEVLQSDLDQEKRVSEDLRADVTTLENNIDLINIQLLDTKAELKEAEAVADGAQAEIDKRDTTISELQQQNQALVDTANTATAKATELEAENLRFAQKIESLNSTIEAEQEKLVTANKEINGYKNLVKEKDDRITLLQSQLNSVIAERDEAKGKVAAAVEARDTAIANLDRAKEDITVLQNQLQQSKTTILDLNARIASLEVANRTIQGERDDAVASKETLQKAYEVLDAQMETTVANLTTLQDKANLLTKENADLLIEIKEANEDKEGLTAKLAKATAAYIDLDEEMEMAKTKILSLNGIIAQLEEDLANSGDNDLKLRIKELEEQVLDLETDLEELENADKEWEKEMDECKKSARKKLMIVGGVLLVAAIIGFST